MMMNVSRELRAVILLLLIDLLLVTAPAFPQTPAAPPSCVVLSKAPLLPPVRLDLEEIWRCGGPDDDLIFGRIAAVTADSSGNLYLLDARLKKVHGFGPDGRYLGVLAVEGDGPGEIRYPTTMVMLPGGVLGVLEAMPGRLVRIDPHSGDPLPSTQLEAPGGGLALAATAHAAGEHLAVTGFTSGTGDGIKYLSRFGPAGREILRLLTRENQPRRTGRIDLGAEYFLEAGRWDMAPDGTVYAAPERDRYLISVFRPDGSRESWEREFESRRRDGDEMECLVAGSRGAAREMGIEFVPRQTPPCVKRIWALPGGGILVRHNRSETDLPEGVMRRCDLFDRDGRLLREVRLSHRQGDGVLDRLFFPAPGIAVLVRGGDPLPCRPGLCDEEPWPMETIVCRVRWPRPAEAASAARPQSDANRSEGRAEP